MIEPVKLGTEAMVLWLRALNALAKDLHCVPNTHMAVHNHPVVGNSMPSSELQGTKNAHGTHTCEFKAIVVYIVSANLRKQTNKIQTIHTHKINSQIFYKCL